MDNDAGPYMAVSALIGFMGGMALAFALFVLLR